MYLLQHFSKYTKQAQHLLSFANKKVLYKSIGSSSSNAFEKNTIYAVCVAERIKIHELLSFCKANNIPAALLKKNIALISGKEEEEGKVFIFEDGMGVFWNGMARSKILEIIKPFHTETLPSQESETINFSVSEKNIDSVAVAGEEIIIPNKSPINFKEMQIAISRGLADSVKLALLENSLDSFVDRIKQIAPTLANGRPLPLTRKQVLKLTGKLLEFRAKLNLHSEFLDSPEQFWNEPELESIYNKVIKIFDIRKRARLLNTKLDYSNELMNVLRSHLSEEHGLKLEWGIIVLIAVEVGFESAKLIGEYI